MGVEGCSTQRRRCRRLTRFLLGLLSALVLQPLTPLFGEPESSILQVPAPGRTGTVDSLRIGDRLRLDLSSADRAVTLELGARDYARILVDACGAPTSVLVSGPEGEQHGTFRLSGENGPVTVSLITDQGGLYRFQIAPLAKVPGPVGCGVEVEDLGPASEERLNRLATEKKELEAESLTLGWKRDAVETAISLLEQSSREWRDQNLPIQEVRVLRRLGMLHFRLLQVEQADACLKEALALARQMARPEEELLTMNEMVPLLVHRGDKLEARSMAEEALNLSRTLGDPRAEARALDNLGLLQYLLGDMDQSESFHHAALERWRVAACPRGEAETLTNLGFSYLDKGQETDALKVLDEALPLWAGLNNPRGRALTLQALGVLNSKLDRKREALDLFEQARMLVQPLGDPQAEAILFNFMAQVYSDMGMRREALQHSTEALARFRTAAFALGEGSALLVMGICEQALGQEDRALSHYQDALRVYQTAGDSRSEAVVLRSIGNLYAGMSRFDEALSHYNTALERIRKLGDPYHEALLYNERGAALYRKGALEAATEDFSGALALVEKGGYRYIEAITRFNLAQLERARGNLGMARSQFESVLSTVESIRADVAGQELRSSYFASSHRYFQFYIDLLMQMHGREPSAGYDQLAFQASERARARSLLDGLAEASVEIRQGIDPGMGEAERELRRRLNDAARRQMELPGSASDNERAAMVREIDDLTAEYDRLQALIRIRSPRYAALTQPEPLGLREIQGKILDKDTLLLEYSLGPERSYLWVVGQSYSRSYELPKDSEIEAQVRRIYAYLTARQSRPGESTRDRRLRIREAESSYWREAQALSNLLLGPAAELIKDKRLAIVSEGALQYLPFAALPVPSSGDSVDSEPLVAQHEIIMLPSASTLAALRNESSRKEVPDKLVAVLADPVFDVEDPRIANRDSHSASVKDTATDEPAPRSLSRELLLRDFRQFQQGDSRIPRLPFTQAEASSIVALVPPESGLTATGFDANRPLATSPQLGRYRIVHFATHGILNSEYPGLSGIVLSMIDREGKPQDGFLRLHDIYNLSLPVELVVLSACSSALGREVKGEGLVGLVRGFMYAGASRVVASLWKVDDEATKELMVRFYTGMLKGKLRAAEALRQAQISMWRDSAWQSPYYWGAFVIQGEWG